MTKWTKWSIACKESEAMRGITLLGKEFAAIFKSKKILIPIIAILFIPVLYAGMFLWAFWDPYGQLDDLPVAVVNLDEGAVFSGKPVEVGNELVDTLKEDQSMKWDFVSEKTAKEGMKNRKYYMLIRIPKDFSSNVTTLLTDNPEPLNLEYIPNESLNFLSSQIGGAAVEQIKGEVANSLTKTFAEEMFHSMEDVSQGFADATEGANKLHDGSGQVTDGLHLLQGKTGEMQNGVKQLLSGSGQVTDGLNVLASESQAGIGALSNGSLQIYQNLQLLASNSSVFNDGLQKASAGSNQLQAGMNQLAGGLGQLQNGQAELANGAQQVQSGINGLHDGLQQSSAGVTEMQNKLPELTKGTEEFSAKASQFAQGVSQWQEKSNELSDGAKQTEAGAQSVADGLAALNEQIQNLPDGETKQQLQATVQQLAAGSKDVAAGTKQVAQGAQGLAGKAGEIQGGATQLAGGAKAIHDGQTMLQDGVNALQSGQNQLVEGSNQLAQGQQAFMTGFQTFGTKLGEAQAGAAQLAQGSTELNKGVSLLATGSPQLVDGVNQLAAGAGQLNGGLGQLSTSLNSGIGQLAGGSAQLTSGLGELSTGSGQLIEGVGQLADGSKQISDGTGELAESLGEGAEQTGEVKGTEKTYDMFADPVKLQTEKVAEVPNYGTGFAPYFLSLGLFVGALMLSIVYPLSDTVGIPKSGFSWFISKFGVLLSVGIIQALVADVILMLGLGIEVQSVPYFILFSILTSLAFIALIQCLVTAFGDAGRFIAILTLILQLTTSAGTFPLELIPKPLQVFNAWLPMTYSVSGFKAVISSGDFSFMWQNAGILIAFIILFSLGTIGALTWMHKRKFSHLVEERSIEA